MSMPGACAHCGLPVGRRALEATVAGVRGDYCCFGCVLGHQITRATGEGGVAAAILVRLGLATFFAVNVMMVTMPSYVPAIYGGEGVPTDGPLFVGLRWLAMAFAAPVLVLLGWPILAVAWQSARSGVIAADALVVLGAAAAYGLSVANTVQGRAAVYYDTGTMLLVLVTIGRYLDARARAEAGDLVRRTLAPGLPPALREAADGRLERVEVAALAVGDVVRVSPGDTCPTDGIVLDGEGGVNEAAVTGEALPVLRRAGDRMTAGACSVDGTFRVRVLSVAAESTTARIAALVGAALRERTRAEAIADRVASVLVPLVVALALAAGAWWARAAGIERGLLVALAVLVVACPCGLGLATPLAIWTGIVAAAARGIVVRRGAVLERLAAVRTILFDKTGTLTTGEPRVGRIEPAARARDVVGIAASLEHGSAHPLARGIARAARELGVATVPVGAAAVVPGRGITGVIGGAEVAVGSPGWIESRCGGAAVAGSDGDRPAVAVARDGAVVGWIWMADVAGEGAARAIDGARSLGVAVGVLTGDARTAGIGSLFAPGEIRSELAPEDKVAHVRAARARGAVAVVGDGFNDAPALAAADVGIAVGDATDLTRTTADVVVGAAGVAEIPWLVAHARRVVRVARQNLAWAFGYNAIAVGLAVTGRLEPVVAALAMLGSSLTVVANARRLRAAPGAPAGTTAAPLVEDLRPAA